MTRLIDADALIEAMTKFSNATGEDMTHGIFYAHIAPTIDAEPVKRGHWIETEEYHGFDNEVRNKALSCSVCRVAFRISDYAQIEDFRYCPNCGCRMDKE